MGTPDNCQLNSLHVDCKHILYNCNISDVFSGCCPVYCPVSQRIIVRFRCCLLLAFPQARACGEGFLQTVFNLDPLVLGWKL